MKPVGYILIALCLSTYLTYLLLQDTDMETESNQTRAFSEPTLIAQTTTPNTTDVSSDPIDHLPKQAMILSHMAAIEHCEANNECPFADTDPKSVYFAVGMALKKDIQLLTLHASEQPNLILLETAKTYFVYQNDHVREAALNLMATQPPDQDNVPVLLEGLAQSHDANIYRMALVEFQRYPDQNSQQHIHAFLSDTLSTGGIFAKRTIANNLLPLLSTRNIDRYRAVLTQLSADQSHSRALKQIIEEFDRQQTGG
ncbi:MAG: hypothetical protein HOM11_11815 [Methylococcales bacterium]|jgi:hypothetical protein|nr:hypothetical protein [Methylococcales bacterium]MBT7444586.1 hypothetical protein [Methylococcales bacterium]